MDTKYFIISSQETQEGLVTTTHSIFLDHASGDKIRVGILRRYEGPDFAGEAELIFQGEILRMEENAGYVKEPGRYPHHICPYISVEGKKTKNAAYLHRLFPGTGESYLEWERKMYPVIRNEAEGSGQVYNTLYTLEGDTITYPVKAQLRRTHVGKDYWESTLQFQEEEDVMLTMAIVMTLL